MRNFNWIFITENIFLQLNRIILMQNSIYQFLSLKPYLVYTMKERDQNSRILNVVRFLNIKINYYNSQWPNKSKLGGIDNSEKSKKYHDLE